MRLLGLDYGDKRIGVALGDTQGRLASPHGVFHHKGWGPDARRISALMQETGASGVVLGLPRNMDGSLGPQAREAKGLGERLEACGITVYYQDERLSSFEAEEALRKRGLDSRRIKDQVDQTAAAFILQRYLDSLGYNDKAACKKADRECVQNGQEGKHMADDKKVNPEGEMIEEELLLEDETDSNLVELTDEDGNVAQFEYLDTVEHKGESYVVFMAVEEDTEEDEEEEGEVVILQIAQDDEGEDIYVTVEDDELVQEVFEKFMESLGAEDED